MAIQENSGRSPPAEYMNDLRAFFFENFPDARQFENKIHIIYATTQSEYSFLDRSKRSILEEVDLALKSGKTKIVFFGTSETLLANFIHKAQEIANEFPPMPIHTFFYSCAGLNASEEYEKMIKDLDIHNRLTMLISNSFALVSKKCAIKKNYEYKIKLKEKKFVCFNLGHRGHRIILFSKMVNRDLYNLGFYSFEGFYKGWINQIDWSHFDWETKETFLKMEKMFPIRLNINNARKNPVDISEGDYYYHEESYFSLITETTYYQKSNNISLLSYLDCQFFSEKTYRAIHLKHPFVLVSFPGALDKLKELGYQTFHPYINESYDREYDDEKRLDIIVDEVDRLCNLTNEEYIEWQQNIKNILDHNYNILMQTRDYSYNSDIDLWFN